MTPTIAAGFISDEARALLLAHQVHIVERQGLQLITLDRMIGGLNSTIRPLEYVIGFWLDDEAVEEDTLIVHLNCDAGETKVIAKPSYWTAFMNEERPVV